MFIDNEEVLSEIREASIKSIIESLNTLLRVWEFTTSPFKAKFPIMFQPILFNGFKIEQGAISFIYESPIVLNVDGDFNDDLYSVVYKYHLDNPKLACYALYHQIDDIKIVIQYEDLLGCLNIQCSIGKEVIIETNREKVDRIPILNYPEGSSSPN